MPLLESHNMKRETMKNIADNLERFINDNSGKIDLYNVMNLGGIAIFSIMAYQSNDYIAFLRENNWYDDFDIYLSESTDVIILTQKIKD